MSEYQSYPSSGAQTNSMAVISLVSGIASWIFLPLIGSLVAVITGHMAKNQIRASMGTQTGDGLATAGLVLGYLNLGLALLGICLVFVLLAAGLTIPFCFIPFANETSALIGLLFGM